MFRNPPPLILALLAGLLLPLAWYAQLGWLVFLAWIPLFQLENLVHDGRISKLRFWALTYLAFLGWNLIATWWIVYASFGGAAMAILANALLMSLVFLLYSGVRRVWRIEGSQWLLIPLWLSWEYLHSLWDLSWIWLNLGNVFAFHHNWVQWFEFTGSSGGTVWALAVNIMLYAVFTKTKATSTWKKTLAFALSVLLFPILISYAIRAFKKPLSETNKPVSCLVLQPNVDPYNIKFVMEYGEQFSKALRIAGPLLDSTIDYLILPETFITNDINEAFLNRSVEIQAFRDSLLRKFPKLKIVTGGNTYTFYEDPSKVTATARFDERSGLHYDAFNSAIFITTDTCVVYHKSKLVPGVEKMPFPALFKPLEKLALDLGGTVGSLGLQEDRTVFDLEPGGHPLAPVICYESIYSDYLSAYIRNGAQWICIVTNDGWWEDTPGYRQHMNYARLRAIENRRQIARSANTGTSCFMNEFGDDFQQTAWWKEAAIHQDIYPNGELTFFSRYGDLLSKTAVGLSAGLLLFAIWIRMRDRRNQESHK